MTKAMTKGERNRRRYARVASVCSVTGVEISAATKPRPHGRPQTAETPEAARMIADAHLCRLMGWPYDEYHRARCRDQRIGTLYGRLAMLGRLGKQASERANDDAMLGLAEWDRLDRQYHRIVLGRAIPGDAETHADPDGLDPRAIADRWMAAQAVLTREGPAVRDAVAMIVRPDSPDIPPASVDERTALHGSLGGLALARHFGLRA